MTDLIFKTQMARFCAPIKLVNTKTKQICKQFLQQI